MSARQRFGQGCPSLRERLAGVVGVPERQQVERDKRGRGLLGKQPDPAVGRMNPLQQRLEVQLAAVGVRYDDLAVDHAALGQTRQRGADHLGEVAGHRPLIAAADLYLGAVAEDDRPEAIPFRLIAHRPARNRADRLRQHRRDRGHDRKMHGPILLPATSSRPRWPAWVAAWVAARPGLPGAGTALRRELARRAVLTAAVPAHMTVRSEGRPDGWTPRRMGAQTDGRSDRWSDQDLAGRPSHESTGRTRVLNRPHRSPAPRPHRSPAPRARLAALRPWLALLAAVLVVGVLLPPAATAAGRYAFAQALQFVVLAVAGPALLVTGAPWRIRPGRRLVDRVAMARSHHRRTARAWILLACFIALVIGWRLPVVVNTLVRHPLLVIAEAVTLIAVGCALWLELVESPPLLPTISRPLRAAFAALPMWTIWTLAYIMGFSRGVWFTALAHQPGHGLGTVADQQIAAAILWAVPAVCFVPAVYVSLLSWLRDSSDPDAELRGADSARRQGQPGTLRPPRGWRAPSS